jgi:hypothetical protein
MTQSEQELEQNFIQRLTGLGYEDTVGELFLHVWNPCSSVV